MRIPEGGKRDKGTAEISETIRIENFPKLTPNTKPLIEETPRTPSRINAKKLHIGISY